MNAMKERIFKISEGNPGALNVLLNLAEHLSGAEYSEMLVRLELCNYSGSKIWVGFKDACKRDIALFAYTFGTKRVVDCVNEVVALGDCGPDATPVKCEVSRV